MPRFKAGVGEHWVGLVWKPSQHEGFRASQDGPKILTEEISRYRNCDEETLGGKNSKSLSITVR